MDINTKIATTDALSLFAYWKEIPIEDISPLRLNKKIEQSISGFVDFLNLIDSTKKDSFQQYLSFVWSISVRDFAILLRDSLLATVKHEQFKKDDKDIQESYTRDILSIIQKAAHEISDEFLQSNDVKFQENKWQHQESPIKNIIEQLKEIQIQVKKIYRSNSKIDNLRVNINEYVKDFHMQYSKQANAVKQLFTIVEEVKTSVHDITKDSSEADINNAVDQIGDSCQKLELMQGIESIDILPYESNETLSLPVATNNGNLIFKSINIKSEFAGWFSSSIYPKIIELESKRDQAVEKCLLSFSQIRTKTAAIALAEVDESTDLQKEFDQIFSQLNKEVLEVLKFEEEDTNALVQNHQDNYLIASNVYSDNVLFLPGSGSSQISNLSKDAQRRVSRNFTYYKKELKTYINKVLSRYVEVDKTPYGQFVRNQTSIYDEDDTLALFLKKGYLGKSFTVPRPEIINPIVEEYRLWLEGFSGAVLMSGLTGSGKSTMLGMLNHIGLNEDIILLKTGESYFIEHRSYDPVYDLKELIKQVLSHCRGKRVIICIDDLELWHNDQINLFDNINTLLEAIVRYRKKVFFVVTCSPFLKHRIELFNDLDTVFSSLQEMKRMSANQLRSALSLRARVNDSDFDENEMDYKFKNTIRESKGNVGHAMLEFCRINNGSYKSNVKSLEFKELILSNLSLLNYISTYNHCSIQDLSNSLSDLDFSDTMKSIDRLVGQKILIRPRSRFIAINPLLIHVIEKILIKTKR